MEAIRSTQLKPFIRWAGSKRLLLPELSAHVPETFNTYIEPFLGGGSLYLHLAPKRALLGDMLEPLTTTWQAVKDDPEALANAVSAIATDRITHNTIRLSRPSHPLEQAARFLYLNRTSYGGLWRVNLDGQFNVPWSEPKSATPLDRVNLTAAGAMMSETQVEIHCTDFTSLTHRASSGDLVFLDPPYSKASARRPFIHYNEQLFDWSAQLRLAQEAERLRRLGAHVLLTNSTHPEIATLYPNFKYVDLERQSSLSRSTVRKSQISERLFIAHNDK